jgi:hypothetical protein
VPEPGQELGAFEVAASDPPPTYGHAALYKARFNLAGRLPESPQLQQGKAVPEGNEWNPQVPAESARARLDTNPNFEDRGVVETTPRPAAETQTAPPGSSPKGNRPSWKAEHAGKLSAPPGTTNVDASTIGIKQFDRQQQRVTACTVAKSKLVDP